MRKSAYVIPDTTLVLDHSFQQEYPLLLRDLPTDEKPREKLILRGPEALTQRELLALILHTGTVREDVALMSERILRGYGDSVLSERDPQRLSDELDIPLIKACIIVAVGELGRRAYEKDTGRFATIRNAKDVYDHLVDMRSLPKEYLRSLFLNAHNRIIRNEVISIGTVVSSNIIHPREVFRSGIESNAVAVVLAHNHPSGEATPSAEDVAVTEKLIEAGKIIGIRVLDHVIITSDSYASVKAGY